MDKFEDYIKIVLPDWYDDFSEAGWNMTISYINTMQAIIDKQAAEIAALRGFANKVVNSRFRDLYLGKSKKYGLIDENGNPTKLLTGESE